MAYKGRVRPTIALTAADIAVDAVGSSEIATDAVTADEIAAGVIAGVEIASTFDITSKTEWICRGKEATPIQPSLHG